MEEPTRIKLVVVGDGSVGKTCILLSFAKNEFPKEYVPTVFDNMTTTLKVNGQVINLGLWDTAGQEEYSSLRQLAYPNSDIFLIIFSVIEPASFSNARKKWYPELEECVPTALKIFVGNKIDMREEEIKKSSIGKKNYPVSFEIASKLIQEETKCKYLECSALTQLGLRQIFEEACKTVLAKRAGSNRNSKQLPKQQKKQTSSICQLI